MMFGNKQLTTEDRLEELEKKIPVLIERIQRYNSALEEIAEIKNDFDEFKETVNENRIELINLVKEFVKYKEECNENSKKVISSISDINAEFHQFKRQSDSIHSDLKTCSSNLEKSINESKDTLNSVVSTKLEYADIFHFENRINSTLEGFRNSLNSLESKAKNLGTAIEKINQGLNFHTGLVSGTASDVENLKHALEEIPGKISAATELAIKNSTRFTLEFTQKMSSDVNALKQAVIPNASIDKKLQDIESSHQLVSLDVSNNGVRMGNILKQMTIMEKKIESIFLLLKKHELSI